MTNFFRAVRMALQYKFSVAVCLICSLLVAVLWGANLGAVYPFVEVVFKGESMPDWVDGRIDYTEERLVTLPQEMEEYEASLATAQGAEAKKLQQAIRHAQMQMDVEKKSLASLEQIQGPIHQYMPDTPYATLILLVCFLIVATFVKDFLLVINVFMVERLGELVAFDLRKEFFRRAIRMDLASFGKEGGSELLSRMTHDLLKVRGGITLLFGRMIREPLKMVACLAGAAFISWRLLLFSLILTPIAGYLIQRLGKSIKRANRRAMEEMAGHYSMLSDTFNGIEVVKAFTRERFERSRYHDSAKVYFNKAMKIAFYNSFIKPSTEFLGIGVISLAILSGGYLVLNQETHLFGIKMCTTPISLPAGMAFFALLAGISDPARKLSDIVSYLQAAAAAGDRVYEMMDREPGIADPTSPKDFPQMYREITFENLSFEYLEGDPILKQIDFSIRRGETLAIVGPNGCGKSTFIKLLVRFYDPKVGSVSIGGVDLKDLRIRDLREQIGMVTQQAFLFDDTVMNNIRYGAPGATDEQVFEAAKKAHAHSFIEGAMEDGYETMVGNGGSRLSGGQRQRVALARAMLRDPEILLLDEATSQIDPESERLIHDALRDFVKDRTTIFITHRPSSLDLADRILVMDEGRIADLGTHEELIHRCPLYGRLFAKKAG